MEIKAAIKQICAEKGLSEEAVLDTINSALAAAFRKDFGDKMQNVQAEFNIDTGEIKVFDAKEVVENLTPEELAEIERIKKEREELKEAIARGEITAEELRKRREEKAEAESGQETLEENEEERRFNPKTQIQLCDAQKIDTKYQIGDIVKTELPIPGSFGRMAAQTAKQVIIQKLREAERNVIYQEYKDKEGQILTAMVQKFDGKNVIVDLDRTAAIMPPPEQIHGERYRVGDRVKVYLTNVSLTTRGPEIIVSRSHPEIIKKLFALEIPEIASGVIEIKGIAREAGNRTKIAVSTGDNSIDPIGSCIGQRGARIQTIINELNNEKIDIIEYSDNPVKYITNALLPAKVTSVQINEGEKNAVVVVPENQLSLTIGRAGQNVRLASKLTGWRINIKEQETGKEIADAELVEKNKQSAETPEIIAEAPKITAEEIQPAGKANGAEEKPGDSAKKKKPKKTKIKKAKK